MAIENLKSQLSRGVNTYGFYNALANVLKITKVHHIHVDIKGTATLVRKAVFQAIRDHHRGDTAGAVAYVKQYKEEFHVDKFIVGINTVVGLFNNRKGYRNRTLRSGIFRGQGYFSHVFRSVGVGGGKALFIIPVPTDHVQDLDYIEFLKLFRDRCYHEWLIKAFDILRDKRFLTGGYKEKPNPPSHKAKKGSEGYSDGRKREFAVGVHDPITVPMAWIDLEADKIQASIKATVDEIDIVQRIIDGLDVTYQEKPTYNPHATGGFKFEMHRLVDIKLGIRNVDMFYDLKNIDNILAALTRTQRKLLDDALGGVVDSEKAAEAIVSPSFKQQAAQAAQYAILRDLMQKNKKYIKTKKIKTKKPNPKKRNATIKKGKMNRKVAKTAVSIPQIVKVSSSKRETGKGKEASTQDARELARLTKYINSRLGAEVRRKHGTEGMLKQRSGIFSRSVKLESLHQSANSIVAKYSYMLTGGGVSKNRAGVYQTFENTGVKKWRLSYNPKNIITKSIRSLAEAEIKKKFGKQLRFRRV